MKKYFTAAAAALICFICCLGFTLACALVPHAAISANALKSADYYDGRELFEHINCSDITDNYADTIWLSIAYRFDSAHPLSSAMKAEFPSGGDMNASDAFISLVKDEYDGSFADYSRYWHGTASLLRLLFVFFDVWGMKILSLAAVVTLSVIYIILLIKRRQYALSIVYVLLFALFRLWNAAVCFEYAPCVIFALLFSIIIMKAHRRGAGETFYMAFFAAAGILTCYFDFLTTETLTFTLPFLTLFLCRRESSAQISIPERAPAAELLFTVKCGGAWFCSYAFMFAAKWGISAVMFGGSTLSETMADAALRISGNIPQEVYGETIGALANNLGELFPISLISSTPGRIIAAAVLFILILCAVYLFRPEGDFDYSLLLLPALALIPAARYVLLRSHSCLHYFFTYRALLPSAAALILFLILGLGFDHRRKRR
ncbi:MAG: hypothetical protein WCQ72_02125 [Eubacteriales bacterium]